jgi:hypothetical protein
VQLPACKITEEEDERPAPILFVPVGRTHQILVNGVGRLLNVFEAADY